MQKVIVNVGKSKNSKSLVYGKYHEKEDLTKRTCYKYSLMKCVGLNEESSTLVKRDSRWKTYNNHVQHEIRALWGRMNSGMKTCICEGV